MPAYAHSRHLTSAAAPLTAMDTKAGAVGCVRGGATRVRAAQAGALSPLRVVHGSHPRDRSRCRAGAAADRGP